MYYTETLITLPALADAVIMPGFPDQCFGRVPSMLVSSDASTAGMHETVLKFQMAGLDINSICGGEKEPVVVSAKVHIYSLAHSSFGGTFVTTSDSAWEEDGVTWNTAPKSDGIILKSLGAVVANEWYTVDVAPAFILGEDLSIRIVSSDNDEEDQEFKGLSATTDLNTGVAQYASKEYPGESLRPVLNITCIS